MNNSYMKSINVLRSGRSVAMLWSGFLIAALTNTLLPMSGLSNLVLLLHLTLVGLLVFNPFYLLMNILGGALLLSLFALTGLHGVDLKDLSAAISVSLIIAYIYTPVRRVHSRPYFYLGICGISNVRVLSYPLIAILSFAIIEFVYAILDFRFTSCTMFPRASAPMRLDPFVLDGIPGCAYDSNNLGAVIAIIIAGLAVSLSFSRMSFAALLGIVVTGSRTLLLALLVQLASKSFFRLGVLIALVSALSIPFLDEDFVTLYTGRIDFFGQVEGSFHDRSEVIQRSINLIDAFPPADKDWVRVEDGVVYNSTYNGFLTFILRFGPLALFFLVSLIFLAYWKLPRLRGVLLTWIVFNFTGEFIFNYFCTFALCMCVGHLRARRDIYDRYQP